MTETALILAVNPEASQDAGWAASLLGLEGFECEAVLDQDESFGEGLAALREVLGLQWDLVVTFGSVPSD
jgi:hypothetical protein